MRILTFTSLYPNAAMTSRGVFVENRLRHLLEDTDIECQVVAPIPWFPFSKYMNDEYRDFSQAPYHEIRYGITITHPRYLHLPKVGIILQPVFMAISAFPVIRKMIKSGYDFDLIDAHYFYPDGVAAAFLAKWLKKPFIVTARGTDLNLIPQYKLPRGLIRYAATKASALITVCHALKDVLVDLGIDGRKVIPLRNGVDLQMFSPPTNREQLRQQLGIMGKTLLSVGYLIERKGHNFTIEALKYLPDVTLLIAGTGPEQNNLQALIQTLGLAERVKMLGAVPHERLKDYYGAVDIMVLASSREGWANVLLESMACGTPVVATDIWGTPEVVACNEAGVLVERNARSIADGVTRLFDNYPDRSLTRKYAEKFSWHDTSIGQSELFTSVVSG